MFVTWQDPTLAALFQSARKEPMELDADKIEEMRKFVKSKPNFIGSYHYHTLRDLIKIGKNPLIYEDYMALDITYKNVTMGNTGKARRLSDLIKELPFLFRTTRDIAISETGQTFEKKIIWFNILLTEMMLRQYPDGEDNL